MLNFYCSTAVCHCFPFSILTDAEAICICLSSNLTGKNIYICVEEELTFRLNYHRDMSL